VSDSVEEYRAEIICTILGLRICLINELTGATRNPL